MLPTVMAERFRGIPVRVSSAREVLRLDAFDRLTRAGATPAELQAAATLRSLEGPVHGAVERLAQGKAIVVRHADGMEHTITSMQELHELAQLDRH